jgi:hypothetical protein
MQLANCESHSPSGALVGAQAPAGNHDEGMTRLSIAVAANQSEQCMFSRNTFGALEPLDTFELALLPLSHLYISMPRATSRKGPRAAIEPCNESGASTVAGPSRGPRAPAAPARRPRQPEDEDDDDEEGPEPRHRLRETPAPPARFLPDGTPIATGYGKRRRRPPARPDDSPDPNQRRRCDRCERMRPMADFASARGQLATCLECRAQFAVAREAKHRQAEEARVAGLRALFREFGMAQLHRPPDAARPRGRRRRCGW